MPKRGRGEGSIYQRADGRWTAAVDLGFQNGRRVRKTIYGKTRKEVAGRLAVALGKVERGALVNTDDRITVAQHLDHWRAHLAVRPRTLRQYEQVSRLYLVPTIGPIRLTALQPDDVRAMVRGLEERGLSARTVTLARDVLRIALNQAVADELVARNVATLVRRPKARRRDCDTLSPAESRILLDALRGHRLEAMVTAGVALGLRLGEVLGLQWADVDLSARRLVVRHSLFIGKGGKRELADVKSRESRRLIALPDLVVQAFERHRAFQLERRMAAGAGWQRTDFVFTTRSGRPMDGTLVTRDLKTLAARLWSGGRDDCGHRRTRGRECLDCGAQQLPRLTFHSLRHSCASLLLAAGMPVRDVSELLGHSDVRLTLQTYAHVIEEGRERTARAIDRVFDSQTDSQTVRRGRNS